MADTVHQHDAAWRDAASMLGLDLFNAKDRKVRDGKGKRAHEMRGRVDDRLVRVRYGLQSPADGITVMHVRLARPLLLGLLARTYSPPKNARARSGYDWGMPDTTVHGIERARVTEMFEATTAGPELGRLLRELGLLGWVELRDGGLQSQSEIYSDSAAGYVDLVRSATRIVLLAEAARAELGPAPWEAELRAKLDAAASDHRLESSPARFRLTGVIRSSRVSVQLEANERYALLFKAMLPVALPPGAGVMRRSGLWSKLAMLARIDRPTGDAAFNQAFDVTGALRGRLGREATASLLQLSREGDVSVDHEAIVHRTATLNVNVSDVLSRLGVLAERVAPGADAASGSAPYR